MKINQSEIVREIASLTGINQDKTKLVMNTMREVILKHIKDKNDVALLNLCTFKYKFNPPRPMKKPKTREPFISEGSVSCTISPSKDFKNKLNGITN